MLRRCVLTVFSETDSSPAISGRDRFVGRYRSTRSSPGLSSSARLFGFEQRLGAFELPHG